MPIAAPVVKLVGANGQISLGKQYAGRQVLVEERAPGVWLVRTATVIPDDERWLHTERAAADLKEALDSGKVATMDVSVGDTVLYGKYSGTEVTVEGKDYIILRADDVLAIVEEAGVAKKEKVGAKK